MATTATTVNLIGKPFPFIGIGIPAAQLPTHLPSAELNFSTEGTKSITVAGAGEDQSLFITCPLPRSFCYVLVEATMRIASVAGADWDQEAQSDLKDSISSPFMSIPVLFDNPSIGHGSSTEVTRTYQVTLPPKKLIVPLAVDDARFGIKVFNTTIDGEVGTVEFYARFLRYDRNQAQFWQVNTPVYTR